MNIEVLFNDFIQNNDKEDFNIQIPNIYNKNYDNYMILINMCYVTMADGSQHGKKRKETEKRVPQKKKKKNGKKKKKRKKRKKKKKKNGNNNEN